MLEELMESPAFWMLGGGAVIAEVLGWIISKNTMENAFPIWQLLILIAGTLVAAAFIALKE